MAITKIGTPELFDFSATNTALQLPSGDTASRPTSPSTGEWRYNTDDNYVEYYDGAAWFQIDYEAAAATCTTDTINYPSGTTNTAYYKMSDATDSTLNAYNGTATSVDFNVQGKFGNAGEFNGLQTSSASYMDITSSTTSTTSSISLWFNTTVKDSNQGNILDAGGSSSSNTGFSIIREATTGYLGVSFTDGTTGQIQSFTGATDITDGAWHNVVLSMAADNTFVFYLDGSSHLSGTRTRFTSGDTQNLSINRFGTNAGSVGASSYGGSIDQIRIFSTALTAANVTSLYNEVQCVPAIIPSDYFNPLLYNGNGGTQSITGVGFEPDLVWLKSRTDAYNAQIFDSVRTVGANKELTPSQTYAEGGGNSAAYGFVGSLNTDGFTLSAGSINSSQNNGSGQNYVSWNWKAGGAVVSGTGTGAISSVSVSANQDAGFSVVKYSNSGASGTYTHGLNSAPEVVIRKRTDSTSGWVFATTVIDGSYDYLLLNTTADKTNYAIAAPTSTVVTEGDVGTYISYNFHSIPGFSDIGSYIGTNAPNNTIVTGFRPAYLMIKLTSALSGNWIIFDNKRNTSNPLTDVLKADDSGVETTEAALNIDFLSNGFTLNGAAGAAGTGQINSIGETYIYLAIAEQVYNANGVTANQTNPFNDGSQVAQYEFEDNADDSQPNGYIGKGGTFNGSSSGINLPSSLNTNVIDATGAFSISMWINANDISTIQYLFAANVVSNIDLGINSNSSGAGKIVWTIYNGSYSYLTSTTTITTNTWYHIVATYNNSLRELFIDGVSQGTATKTLVESSIEPTLGYRNTGGSVHFNGEMDQVRIYNTALNPNDVWLLYSETSATSSTLDYPASTGAQALYELEGDATSTSSAAYNGTATDVAWVPLYDGTPTAMTYAAPSVSAPFLKAAVFNGSSSYIDTNTTFTPDLMSFSAWVKTNTISPATAKQIISNRGGAGTNYLGIDVGITPNGNIYNRFDNGGSRGDSNSDTVPIPLNTWTHLAFTIDMSNSIQKVYKNGVFVYQETTSGSIASGNDFYIGRYFSGADYWEGSIDQVRIFNKALDAGEILQLYNEPNN